MSEWEELSTDDTITTEELDSLVEAMSEAKADYEAKKKISTEAHADYQIKRAYLIAKLQAANKKKYDVEGVGSVTVTESLKVKTPKDFDDKQKLFDWIEGEMGQEGILSYLGINYNTLNSLYNERFAQAKEEGTGADFNIPGINSPETEYGLRFKK